jgi:hypothetical protein
MSDLPPKAVPANIGETGTELKTQQPRARLTPEAEIESGGDGGGLNSIDTHHPNTAK